MKRNVKSLRDKSQTGHEFIHQGNRLGMQNLKFHVSFKDAYISFFKSNEAHYVRYLLTGLEFYLKNKSLFSTPKKPKGI